MTHDECIASDATDATDKWMDMVRQKAADFDVERYEFGGQVADSVGASLSESREDQVKKQADERRAKAARPSTWQEDLAPLTHEERVEKTLECLSRRQSFMNILRGLLIFCDGHDRTYEEIEAHVSEYAEFGNNRQAPQRYVFFLQRTGALIELELNAEGEQIAEEMREAAREQGATEEDIEDMVADWRVRTTDVGREAVELTDPRKRLSDLLAVKESRLPTYCRVLEFCDQPRSLDAITQLLSEDPGLEIDERTGVMGMQPSAYISKLDQAGVLVWKDGWITTEEGAEVLRSIQEQQVEGRG